MDTPIQRFQVIRMSRRTRLVQDDAVLSEILHAPGPTHRFTDLLAATVATCASGSRVLMLGFAGGGVVAPLRALGCRNPVLAVDLTSAGEEFFRAHSSLWAGTVRLEVAEACAYLRGTRRRFDLILEDLSVPGPAGVTKPDICLGPLPDLIRSRLAPGGVAVFNLLPIPGQTWSRILARVSGPWAQALEIGSEQYWNRAVVAGDRLPTARRLSRELRARLASIRSRMGGRFRVRTLR